MAWEHILRGAGFRVTPQRQVVLEAIESLRHATADQILVEARLTFPSLNLSTVYRVLEALESAGIVAHTHFAHEATTYYLPEQDITVHLVCVSCNEVALAGEGLAASMIALLAREHGFVLDVGHVALHGDCRRCAAARGGSF